MTSLAPVPRCEGPGGAWVRARGGQPVCPLTTGVFLHCIVILASDHISEVVPICRKPVEGPGLWGPRSHRGVSSGREKAHEDAGSAQCQCRHRQALFWF